MYRKLAIVIPAYKIDYFNQTLDSLANQTCKDFTVYVGDDNSTADFESLILKYTDRIDIVYKKFSDNLGKNDLVAQWTRCIDLTQGEPWIWLFSDDDIIGDKCVELFINEINKKSLYEIFHFDVKIIDENDEIIEIPKLYPDIYTAKQLYIDKALGKIESFVVENIFSRKVYNEVGGFQNFDLAWGSDTATWIKMSDKYGLKRITGDSVKWRKSRVNITPKVSHTMAVRKLTANVEYLNWSQNFFNSELTICYFNRFLLLRRIIFYSYVLDKEDIKSILKRSKEKKIIGNLYSVLLLNIFPVLKFLKRSL